MAFDEIDDLVTAYRATPDAVGAMVAGMGSAVVERPGPDGGWSARQVLDHLAASAEGTAKRLRRIAKEERPQLALFDDTNAVPMAVDEGLARFGRARAEEIAVVSSLDADAWDRLGLHPEHGEISIRHILRHMVAHDLEHLGQLARLRG